MKVVLKDNYDREHISDILVAENVPEEYAHHIAEALNRKVASPDEFFFVESDTYKLHVFEP